MLSGIKQLTDFLWEIPQNYKEGMRVPARIYATKKLLNEMDEGVFNQVTNVATLPGIVKYALCMPDGHYGYGFPIGGVAAFSAKDGIISPGGIGFDINCGMRLITTNLTYDEVKPHVKELVDILYHDVPAGVGSEGFINLSKPVFREMLEQGAQWGIQNGYGWEEDLEVTEEFGCMQGADASKVSDRAVKRGLGQLGSLGSGNHYLEVQVSRPEHVYDSELAHKFGITIPNQVVVMFHCGSRGLGHQVATDYLEVFLRVMASKYRIKVDDRELAAAPFNSPEGQDYFAAMKCAMNMSFANRQVILHQIRQAFAKVFHKSPEDLGLHQVFDIAHNTAKLETHLVDGEKQELIVHRKGATRAFPPGAPELPERYQRTGQPVIIGGSMETGSYLLVGVKEGDHAWFSTAHGSGRTMSRTKARKLWRGNALQQDMERRGIYVRSASWGGLAEEAGPAYKNIDEVVDATAKAKLSSPVVRFVPIGNVKG